MHGGEVLDPIMDGSDISLLIMVAEGSILTISLAATRIDIYRASY